MIRYREISYDYPDIFRVYISGSSSAGKTYFAKQLLNSGIFQFKRIYYFHPDFHEHDPVNWNETLDKPVFFQAGLPSIKDLLHFEPDSCLVFDDLFEECSCSKDIDYLFRVLSSKRRLSVIIMTQRYFAQGKFSVSIRNSSNFHVLMNNADARTNMNVANAMKLRPEITRATEINREKLYPYIFLDKTNRARVNNLQVYTEIFNKYREVVIGSMKYYLLTEQDFKSSFTKTGKGSARKTKRKHESSSESDSSETSSSESSDSSDAYSKRNRKNKRAIRKY